MKPKVVYWNNIPTPYVVGRFNAIIQRGNLDFEAWFNGEREHDRSWAVSPQEWQFRARYIPPFRMLGKELHVPTSELLEHHPDVLISLYGDLSFITGVCIGRSLASRSALRVLPTYDTWVGRSHAKEFTKHLVFRGVDAIKVPGPTGMRMARRYGVPADRIAQVIQSVDVEHFARARFVTPDIREEERRRRGLHGCVFLYVGRLWEGKGVRTLLDAYRNVSAEFSDVSLLIVGDGVDQAKFMEQARSLPGVHFEGFVQPESLPITYSLANVFVFPTLGDPHGLVVEEAMAAGLPVISSAAAGDVRERLPEGAAGYVVPPADPDELARCMLKLARDHEHRLQMGELAHHLVLNRSHEAYAVDFEQFIERTLSMPPRSEIPALVMRIGGWGLAGLTRYRSVAPLVAVR